MRERDFTFNTEASTRGLARALITAEGDEIFIKPNRGGACVLIRVASGSRYSWFSGRVSGLVHYISTLIVYSSLLTVGHLYLSPGNI